MAGINALSYEGFAGTEVETVELPPPHPGVEGGNWGSTRNIWTPVKVCKSNICSSEAAIDPCLNSGCIRVVDPLTTANCLLKARQYFSLRCLNFPLSCIAKILIKKKQLYEPLFSLTCTCIVARVNVNIVSSYSVHLNSLPSSKVGQVPTLSASQNNSSSVVRTCYN